MNANEIEFLKSLPLDGTYRELKTEERELAYHLHQEKLVFVSEGLWPHTVASITFSGRKALSRAD